MATPESVKGKIEALTAKVNQTTGVTDTTLTGAVDRLLANYTDFNINGALKQYKVQAGANVAAGDFVEFIKSWGSANLDIASASAVAATALSDTKVLVAYATGSGNYMTVVIDIDAATVAVGEAKTRAMFKSQPSISVTALNDHTALVAYRNTEGSANAQVLKVNGLQQTAYPNVTFTSTNTHDISVVKLNEIKAFVTYRLLNSKYTSYAQVLTIDGTNVVTGTAKSCHDNVSVTRAAVLKENKLIIALGLYDWSASSPMGGLAKVVTIGDDGVTLNVSSAATIAGEGIDQVSIAATSHDQAIVVYRNLSANSAVPYAALLNVTNDTVRKASGLSLSLYAAEQVSIVALGPRKALALSTDYTNRIYKTDIFELTAEGSLMSRSKSTTIMESNSASAFTRANLVGLTDSSVLLVGNIVDDAGTVHGLCYQGVNIGDAITADALNSPGGTFVQPATSNKHNVGVAKTAGAAGETVEVYRVIES